ncbi:MAG: protease modulator HflC, partial [Rhodobacteraceae bacterium]
MKRFTNLLLPILAGLGFLIMSSLYVVDEREKALRLWFGEVTAVIVDPGLNFKVPFLHEIVKYEDRILPLDVQPDEFTPLDDRRLVVDGFA